MPSLTKFPITIGLLTYLPCNTHYVLTPGFIFMFKIADIFHPVQPNTFKQLLIDTVPGCRNIINNIIQRLTSCSPSWWLGLGCLAGIKSFTTFSIKFLHVVCLGGTKSNSMIEQAVAEKLFNIFLSLGNMIVNVLEFQPHNNAGYYAFLISYHLTNPKMYLLFHLFHGFITCYRFYFSTFQSDFILLR